MHEIEERKRRLLTSILQANRATSLHLLRICQLYHLPFMARQKAPDLESPRAPYDSDCDAEENDSTNCTLIDVIKAARLIDVRKPWQERRETGIRWRAEERSSLSNDLKLPGDEENNYHMPNALYGGRQYTISSYIKGHIWEFLKDNGVAGVRRQDIPTIVRAYRFVEAFDGKLIYARGLETAGSNRNRSGAEYKWRKPMRNGSRRWRQPAFTFYGEVIHLLKVELEESGDNLPLYLAVLQDYELYCEEPEGSRSRLLQILRRAGSQDVISARDIVGATGVARNGINGKEYVVKEKTAVIG